MRKQLCTGERAALLFWARCVLVVPFHGKEGRQDLIDEH